MTTPRPPSDAAIRATALDPTRSFIVQAPAGSGKTELLTDRILCLLARVDDPEEIVAITFTQKAAAEMHSRVLEKLRQPEHFSARTRELVALVLQRSDSLGWDLLDQPQRLRIQTIDSLASHLAHQLPWQSRLGSRFAMSDDPGQLYRQAARELLSDMERDVPHQSALLDLVEHLDNDLNETENLLIDMLERRDQWLAQMPRGHSDWSELRALLEEGLRSEILKEFDDCLQALSDDTAARLVPVARFMAAQLDAAGKAHPLGPLAAIDIALERDLEHLPAWQALVWLLLTDKNEWRRKLSATIGLPASSKEGKQHAAVLSEVLEGLADDTPACAGLARLRALPAPHYSDAQWRLLQALFTVLRVAAAYLWLAFQRNGEVDFIEVASRALQALGDEDAPSDILLALDHRLSHLLVDEFQDTSLAQISLLERLTSGWQTGDGRTLFVVGDPMQSIYRFRKAEVSLFLDAQREGIADVRLTPLALTDNFRSVAPIVDWVNHTFSAVMPQKDDLLAGAIRYSPAHPYHIAADGTPPAVHLHAHWQDGSLDAALLTAVQNGLALGPRSTVAILGRTRRQLDGPMQVLRDAGIPYRAVDLQPLSEQPWIQDLLQLTRALLHPADRLAWLTVLRAPWCGLTLADLDRLTGDDHRSPVLPLLEQRWHQLDGDGRLRAGQVLTVMQTYVAARERQPLAVAVAGAWQALGGPLTLPHAAAWQDCRAYLDWLEQQPLPLDLDRLEDRLGRLYAAPDARAEAQRVVVMTMHKSKGLQFDTVLLPALESRGNRDGVRLLLSEESGQRVLFAPVRRRDGQDDDRLYRWLASKETLRGRHETGRLLYVAATRAKKTLHLFATLHPGKNGDIRPPVPGSLLAELWPTLGGQLVPEGPPPLDELMVDDSAEEQAVAPEVPASQPLLRLARVPEARLLVPPQSATPAVIEPAAPAVAAAVGTVVHAWLEQIGRDGVEQWPVDRISVISPLVRSHLRREGVPAAQLDDAEQRVKQALRQTLDDTQGRWLLSGNHPEAHSEWVWLRRDDDGRLQRLVMDRCLVDQSGQRWLVDFKTTQPLPGETLAGFFARETAAHRAQLELYASLLADPALRMGLYFPLLPHWLELPPGQPSLF